MKEMKKQSLTGGQIANSSVRISDFVNKFQRHGRLLSEINVESSNLGPSTPPIIGLIKALHLTKKSLRIRKSSSTNAPVT